MNGIPDEKHKQRIALMTENADSVHNAALHLLEKLKLNSLSFIASAGNNTYRNLEKMEAQIRRHKNG